jgi:heat shock protein HslJ
MKRISIAVFVLTTFLLIGCGGSSQKTTLFTSKWNLETLNGAKVLLPEGKFVTLEIDSERGSAAGKAPCNSYSCSYDEYNDQLKFNAIRSTKMACDQLGLEDEYFGALGKVTGYKITGGKLRLYSGGTLIAEYIKTN